MKYSNEKYNELENLINLAIKYYNRQYNYFNDTNTLNLISFIRKQNQVKEFNFNLLTNALYNNNEYQNFIKKYNILSLSDFLLLYNEFYKEIGSLIKIPRNINIENIDKYNRKNLDISNKISILKNCKNEDIFEINSIFYTYITYYFENNIHYTINKVKDILKDELVDIKNGHCLLLEKIIFTPQTIYGQTDDYAKDYIYIFTDLNDEDMINYNYELHLKLLNILKDLSVDE